MSYSVYTTAERAPKGTARRALLSSAASIALLAIAAPAHAQGVTQLEGIVINSANRTPTEAAKVGSAVEVLTEKDIQKQSKTYLKDYLEQLAGVSFSQNGPPGSSTRLSVRGVGLKYVKVLVDGIDISDPSGTTTETHFEHLLVGDVSRIEVLKGSQSTLYGGDAIGGVISVETKKATKPGFSVSGGAEGGQYNTFNGAATAGYAATDGSNISFTVQGVDTDGFSAFADGIEDDGYRNVTFSSRGEYYLSPSAKIFFAARSLDARLDVDGFGADTIGTFSDTVQHAGRAGIDFSLLDGAFQNTLAIQGMRIERNFTEQFGDSFFDGERVKGEYKGVFSFNERLSLLFGADWEQTSLENSNINYRPEADVAGYFAQLMMEPIDGLVLTGGGRIDEHSTFGQFETYRLTGAYHVSATDTKFRATVGTGFRAPSLDELFGGYPAFGLVFYGNPDLEPEESQSWDVGIDQGFLNGRVKLGATYFELDTENAIAFAGLGIPGQPNMINIPGVTERKGVELTGTALITEGVAVTTAYTYIDTETPTGGRVPFVPRNALTVGIDLQPMDKVELNVTGRYVGDPFQSNFVELDDYFLLSAKASYEFTPGWKAYVRGDNLLDEEYETIDSYGTAGLSVFGGITMSLPND